MSSRKFSRGLRSSKSTQKTAISLEKWQDNCSSRTTQDSTESQKSACTYVWSRRTWLECRTKSPFGSLHRHDPKEATKSKYYSMATVRNFSRIKLTTRFLFKHSFFEHITAVFRKNSMQIKWKHTKTLKNSRILHLPT